jgi:starch-binding outer membrane protein, SusD/RagB family
MKKIWIIPVASMIAFTSCGKFLEKEPDNRTKLDSPEKVSQLLGSAYPQLNYQVMTEVSTDNTGDLYSQGLDAPDWIRLTNDLYTYTDNQGSATSEDTPEGYWFACYRAIAACNIALKAIEKIPTESQAAYKAQKGEALVARAYSHFMLVNLFAKFYNPSTSATDLGVPYVTEPEEVSIKTYNRGTVQSVYQMIEADLQEGMPLIDDNNYTVPKYHFNRVATNAFAARFYLHKKEMDSVIKYATAAIPEVAFPNYLRPWNTVYNNLPLNGNGSLGQTYAKATEPANLLLAESQSWWLRMLGQGRFGFADAMSNYGGADAHIANGPWAYQLASFMTGHLFIPKLDEYFVETSLGSGIGNGWEMVVLFSSEEVLFNLAEAYAYKGENQKAIDLLNTYLSKRLLPYDAATNSLDEEKIKTYYDNPANADQLLATPFTEPNVYTKGIINILLDYKRLEFAHEGMRWFDIIRYGIPVTHITYKDFQRQVVDQTYVLDPNNTHRVFQLPVTAMSQAGLPGNR